MQNTRIHGMHRRMLIFLILYMTPILGVSVDLYAPSMPHMVHALHTTASLMKLSVTIFLLMYGIAGFFFGIFTDHRGRRGALLLGIVLFSVASVLIPQAHNITTLLILRGVQGLGAASVGAIFKAIITDSFDGKERFRITNYFTLTWSLSPLLAPFFGGYLQAYLGWHAPFYTLSIYGFLMLALVALYYEETRHERPTFHTATLIRNVKTMLCDRQYICAALAMMLVANVFYVFNLFAPFILQSRLHFSSIGYGHVALLVGLGLALGNLVNTYLQKIGLEPRRIAFTAFLLSFVVGVLMLIFAYLLPLSATLIALPSALLVFLGGLAAPNCMGVCLSRFPDMAGTAASIVSLFAIAGSGICMSVISFLAKENAHGLGWIYAILLGAAVLAYLPALRTEKSSSTA